jgi:LmbE family N-acetylglucosaminyl deacetylase
MSTRRDFLKEVGLGTTAFAMAGNAKQAMPGRPSSSTEGGGGRPSSIMAIAAHPGDAFFAMGAPVALQAQAGAHAVFLSLTLGERGSPAIAPAQYGQLQREASSRAAQMLKAQTEFLEYPDGELPAGEEAKFAVCDLIRKHKPEVVVTHWRGSWHKDHRACYEIVNDAVFYAGLPALARANPPHSVPELFFADNWEDASGFSLDTYLDITPVFEAWMQACNAFPMWRGETGFRYHDYYGGLAVARGCVSGYSKAVALMSAPDQRTRRLHTLGRR